MNILKQMGIQQWRHRSARPVVDTATIEDTHELIENSSEQGESDVENTDLSSALNAEPVTAEDGFNSVMNQEHASPIESSSANVSTGGFSGSLRQALNQSITDKERKKKANNAPKQSSTEPVLDNQSEQVAVEAKGITPINLSALIPEIEPVSNDVLHELAELGGDGGEHLIQDGVFNNSLEPDVNSSLKSVSDNAKEPENATTSLLDASEIVARDLSKVEWPELQRLIETNEHCPSCGWGNGHLGSGNQNADWFFVIDAPNNRDIQSQALFSGRAGQLFDAMLSALDLSRENVYSTSVFKCAPTDDLSVTPQCDELVRRQIELVSPKVVVTFGEFAAQSIIKSNSPLSSLRSLNEQRCFRSQVEVIPTYSPAEMLDDAKLKEQVWADLKKARGLALA